MPVKEFARSISPAMKYLIGCARFPVKILRLFNET
jgi:hypothetical protein